MSETIVQDAITLHVHPVATFTPDGAETWPFVSAEYAAVPGGVALVAYLVRRPDGRIVDLSCSPDTPAGTVDDVVIVGLAQGDARYSDGTPE